MSSVIRWRKGVIGKAPLRNRICCKQLFHAFAIVVRWEAVTRLIDSRQPWIPPCGLVQNGLCAAAHKPFEHRERSAGYAACDMESTENHRDRGSSRRSGCRLDLVPH